MESKIIPFTYRPVHQDAVMTASGMIAGDAMNDRRSWPRLFPEIRKSAVILGTSQVARIPVLMEKLSVYNYPS
jgi:hypothetical protein